ncbi:MAG: ATP-binding cassette domain-containing protein [Methanobrevibacter sp.]|jgi:ABC-2 type transport system ATP-binding protein|nr:ATP-binding cassette domain-containing protein [Candidatus Methanovirga aequatorialis]
MVKYIIETKDITKYYDNFRAVNSINLKVPENSAYGILGPNGAGKSTLISMLCTIFSPTQGTAIVNGYDIVKEPHNVRKSIGIVFQSRALDDILTGREHLEMHAALYGVKKDIRQDAINDILDLINLKDKIDEKVKNYSGGMKRKLEIGRGLIHRPKVLFLDEPTLGLDVPTRENIWSYIKNLKNTTDITILLTTHYLEEADGLCDEIAIIDQGEIVKSDSPSNLKNELKIDTIILKSLENNKLKDILQNQDFVNELKYDGSEIRLSVDKGAKLIPKIVHIAETNNINVDSIELKQPSLEEVFIKYTGYKINK